MVACITFSRNSKVTLYSHFRDSDDEAEGKNKMVEIVNEVAEENKVQETKEMSAENKAAQALDKVFNQEEESTEKMETESNS